MITDSNQANFVRLSGCGLQEVLFGNKKGRAKCPCPLFDN